MTEILGCPEAAVIHAGDTVIFRFTSLTNKQAAEARKLLMDRLGHLVNDVVVVSAEGIYIIRPDADEVAS